MKTNKPEIVVLVGIQCSGKSTYAEKLYHTLPPLDLDEMSRYYEVLSRDKIRELQNDGKYVFDPKKEARVTEAFDFAYSKYTKWGLSLVLDNTHVRPGDIEKEIQRKPEGYTLRVVFFDCPLWKAYYRNVIRYITTGKWIPFSVINDFKKK